MYILVACVCVCKLLTPIACCVFRPALTRSSFPESIPLQVHPEGLPSGHTHTHAKPYDGKTIIELLSFRQESGTVEM